MKKFIIIALVAVLASVLFVSCNNDVAYTEFLESEGAFVVDGKGYDSLQAAIDAAVSDSVKALANPVIVVKRDVNSRVVSIPEWESIEIDLNGNTLTFVDVKEDGAAFSVKEGASLLMFNGTVALNDETKSLVLVSGEEDSDVTFTDLNVNLADDQFAVDVSEAYIYILGDSYICGDILATKTMFVIADSSCISGDIVTVNTVALFQGKSSVIGDVLTIDSFIYVKEESILAGDVHVSGMKVRGAYLNTTADTEIFGVIYAEGLEKTTSEAEAYVWLDIANTVTVNMVNGFLFVQDKGHVYLENVDDGSIYGAAEGDSAITAPEDIDVDSGIYCMKNEEGITYFGNLIEAVREAEQSEETENDVVIYLLSDDEQDYSENPIAITRDLIIDLNGHQISNDNGGEAVLVVSDGVDLTITSVDKEHLIPTAVQGVFKTSIKGAGLLTVDNVEITGSIVSENDLKSMRAVFGGEITVLSLNDGYNGPGSTFRKDINTEGDVLINKAVFESSPGITSDESVRIWYSEGSVGEITAAVTVGVYNSELSIKSISGTTVSVTESCGAIGTIDAEDDVVLSTPKVSDVPGVELGVGVVNAGENAVKITGEADETYSVINGVGIIDSVTCGDFTAEVAGIYGDVNASGSISISYSFVGPAFLDEDDITIQTSGEDSDIVMDFVTFNSLSTYYANLETTGSGNISIKNSNGSAGSITTSGNVGLSTPETGSGNTLTITGTVVAETEVNAKGNEENHVIFRDSIICDFLLAEYGEFGAYNDDIDFIHTSDADIYDSYLNIGSISYDESSASANNVIITDPLVLPGNHIGHVKKIYADTLIVLSDEDPAQYNIEVGEAKTDSFADISCGKYLHFYVEKNAEATISGGEFGEFTFGGVHSEGNLKIKGGVFYGPTSIIGDGEINICGTTDSTYQPTQEEYYSVRFYGVQFLSEAVSIQCAFFKEEDFADVRSIVNKIDQYASDQKVFVVYSRVDSEHGWTETLSGVARYDLSSRHIYDSESAALYFYMDAYPNYQPSPSYYTITSGLFISDDSAPTFDFGDGMLNVGGCIALQKSEGGAEPAKLYSTKNDLTVYKCADTNIFNAGDSGIAVPTITTAGYCYQGL